eukprot:NODE_38_length_35257_cov_0.939047.p28 type:complete len:123 gc:universal NODE_38_length_35257_cov_0.939047:25749-26117(+)
MNLDNPSAKYINIAEALLKEEINAKEPNFEAKDIHSDEDLKDLEFQYHKHMRELEKLHIQLYNMLGDPRFHLTQEFHEAASKALKNRESLLVDEIRKTRKQREDLVKASRATILALEKKLRA